jgi:phage terminase large subunit-like protein
MFHDSTGLVATHVESGYQWMAGVWERPTSLPADAQWQVPTEEVNRVVHGLFEEFSVWRLYADPPYWQSWIAAWVGEFGEERVAEWWTNRRKPMSAALENFDTAINTGTLSHDGHADLTRHIGNARRDNLHQRDEQGKALWLIRKDRPDSPHKIDLAMAAILSWEARTDAIAAKALGAQSVYAERGVRSLADYL